MTARVHIPEDLGGLLRSDWERVTEEACFDEIDAGIVRQYILRQLPQIDAAAELCIDRKTISRRLPSILVRARRTARKLHMI